MNTKVENKLNPNDEEGQLMYLRLYHFLKDDYFSRQLSFDELWLLVWLQWRANPVSGTFHTSYASLAEDFRGQYTKNHINQIMLSLKAKKYIWFARQRGRRGSFVVELHNYPLSSGQFKDISHRFKQNSDRSESALTDRSQTEVLTEVEGDKQKLESEESPVNTAFSANFPIEADRSSKNKNENKNKNDIFPAKAGNQIAKVKFPTEWYQKVLIIYRVAKGQLIFNDDGSFTEKVKATTTEVGTLNRYVKQAFVAGYTADQVIEFLWYLYKDPYWSEESWSPSIIPRCMSDFVEGRFQRKAERFRNREY